MSKVTISTEFDFETGHIRAYAYQAGKLVYRGVYTIGIITEKQAIKDMKEKTIHLTK